MTDQQTKSDQASHDGDAGKDQADKDKVLKTRKEEAWSSQAPW